MKRQVIIIGGGASGLTAAIAAARQGADVTILEHMDRVGKKILSTGNGRCNLTNLVMKETCYRCSQKSFPMKVLEQVSVQDILRFFDRIGVLTKSKNGYLYPNSEQASAVLDALRLELEHLGVKIVVGCRIIHIKKTEEHRFFVKTEMGDFQSDALILATGSKAAPVTGSDGSGYVYAKEFGHRIISPLPALVQLRCQGKFFKQLAGIRCEAEVGIYADGKRLASDRGELQLTDYGISGIPTFQVSRFASVALHQRKQVLAVIDFLPSMSLDDTRQFIFQRVKDLGYRKCEDFLTGVLNKKLSGVLLKLSGIGNQMFVRDVKKADWEYLIRILKEFETVVTATNSYEQAQVCCGGVDTRQVSESTLESRLVSGLYLTGELLDVDGICGGYNLHWAWSTGMLAGIHAGRRKE